MRGTFSVFALMVVLQAVSLGGCKPSDPIEFCVYNGKRVLRIVDENANDCKAMRRKLFAFRRETQKDIKKVRARVRKMAVDMTPTEQQAYVRRFRAAFASMSRRVRMAVRSAGTRCGISLR